MFIYVFYKDAPELSNIASRRASNNGLPEDHSVEKTLLVNPNCPVRIMLEYIRKKCRLGTFTHYDLCDESGTLMGLFGLNTYAYATEKFEHKKTYYLIVLKMGSDKRCSVLPQLHHDNRLYLDLKTKINHHLLLDELSPTAVTKKASSVVLKLTPPVLVKGSKTSKKKG